MRLPGKAAHGAGSASAAMPLKPVVVVLADCIIVFRGRSRVSSSPRGHHHTAAPAPAPAPPCASESVGDFGVPRGADPVAYDRCVSRLRAVTTAAELTVAMRTLPLLWGSTPAVADAFHCRWAALSVHVDTVPLEVLAIAELTACSLLDVGRVFDATAVVMSGAVTRAMTSVAVDAGEEVAAWRARRGVSDGMIDDTPSKSGLNSARWARLRVLRQWVECFCSSVRV